MLKVRQKETVSMVTRDGVRLDADVYRLIYQLVRPLILQHL
jgi:predicted acyl esterase